MKKRLSKKRILDIALVALFLAAIASLCLYFCFFFTPRAKSESENRTLKQFAPPTTKTLLDGSFQTNFEEAVSDQAFFRDNMLALGSAADRGVSGAAFALLPEKSGCKIINSLPGKTLLVDYNGHQSLMQQPFTWEDDTDLKIREGAAEFGAVADALPHTRIVVCTIEPSFISAANPLEKFYPQAVAGRYTTAFLENLPANVQSFAMRCDSPEQIFAEYYDTDHHFNGTLANKIYLELSDILAQGHPEHRRYAGGVRTVPHTFGSGSKARSALYPKIKESLTEVDADPPEYPVTLDGMVLPRSHKARVLSGELEREQQGKTSPDAVYFNYYAEYFGFDYGVVTYENEKAKNDDVLLLVGPSYTQTFEQLLVQNYRRVFVVDPRYYETFAGEKFDLLRYSKKVGADDVVYVVQPQYFADDVWRVTR